MRDAVAVHFLKPERIAEAATVTAAVGAGLQCGARPCLTPTPLWGPGHVRPGAGGGGCRVPPEASPLEPSQLCRGVGQHKLSEVVSTVAEVLLPGPHGVLMAPPGPGLPGQPCPGVS